MIQSWMIGSIRGVLGPRDGVDDAVRDSNECLASASPSSVRSTSHFPSSHCSLCHGEKNGRSLLSLDSKKYCHVEIPAYALIRKVMPCFPTITYIFRVGISWISVLGDSVKTRGSRKDRKVFTTKAETWNATTASKIFQIQKGMIFTGTSMFLMRRDDW